MEKAQLIRAIRSTTSATMEQIAERFGVSRPLISLIINNKAWVEA